MKRPKAEAVKYVPVEVDPQPTSSDTVGVHLRRFIASFILSHRRRRWEHCLIEAPQKARELLSRLPSDLDPFLCRELRGSEGFPLQLGRAYGTGVYFDGGESALHLSAAEAATLATESDADAIFSTEPGRRALCFSHHGGVWVCERGGRVE